MAEAVGIEARADADAELPAEVGAGDAAVERVGRGRGEVAVGLHVPAADDAQATVRDVAAEAAERRRVEALDRLEEPGLAARGEDLRVGVQQVAGGARRGDRGVLALRAAPEPGGVEVRVEDDVKDGSAHVLPPFYAHPRTSVKPWQLAPEIPHRTHPFPVARMLPSGLRPRHLRRPIRITAPGVLRNDSPTMF